MEPCALPAPAEPATHAEPCFANAERLRNMIMDVRASMAECESKNEKTFRLLSIEWAMCVYGIEMIKQKQLAHGTHEFHKEIQALFLSEIEVLTVEAHSAHVRLAAAAIAMGLRP